MQNENSLKFWTYKTTKTNRKIQLSQELMHVKSVMPAHDGSCVVSVADQDRDVLLCFNSKGQKNWEFSFERLRHELSIAISDYQFICVDSENHKIYQWDIKTNQIIKINYNLNKQEPNSLAIFYFPQPKLFCLAQYVVTTKSPIKLTYFETPLMINSKPILESFISNFADFSYRISKTGNKSELIVFDSQQKNEVFFHTYEPIQEEKGQWRMTEKVHRAHCTFKDFQIEGICKIGNENFLFLINAYQHSKLSHSKSLFQLKIGEQILSEFPFSLQDSLSEYEIQNHFFFGKFSLAKATSLKEKKKLTSFFLIDTSEYSRILHDPLELRKICQIVSPSFNENIISFVKHNIRRVKEIELIIIEVFEELPEKLVTTYLVSQNILGCDYDLLYEVCRLLSNEKKQQKGDQTKDKSFENVWV